MSPGQEAAFGGRGREQPVAREGRPWPGDWGRLPGLCVSFPFLFLMKDRRQSLPFLSTHGQGFHPDLMTTLQDSRMTFPLPEVSLLHLKPNNMAQMAPE